MKYLKKFESSNRNDVVNFLLDFGMFITMNLSKIEQESKNGFRNELNDMLFNLRKPLLNGMSFSDITKDLNNIISNPKLLSSLFLQIRNLLIYIKPRIENYVVDSSKKDVWLDKISNFEERYRKIVL